MAEFLDLEHLKGFDKDQMPPWQMAPFQESRYGQLLDGAGLQVDGRAITAIERSGPLSDWALDPRLRLSRALLDVSVKEKKTVRINFLFVRDTADHQTARIPAAVPNWLSRINEIFRSQVDIEVVSGQVGWVTVDRDLGSVIRRTAGNDEWRYAERYRWGSAGMTFFMVWEYVPDAGTGAGFDQARESTLGTTCLFADEARPGTGATVAHEIGHFLGLRDSARKNSLMYFYPQGRGVYLSREEIDVMNPTGIYCSSPGQRLEHFLSWQRCRATGRRRQARTRIRKEQACATASRGSRFSG